jgi:hypothetical protein
MTKKEYESALSREYGFPVFLTDAEHERLTASKPNPGPQRTGYQDPFAHVQHVTEAEKEAKRLGPTQPGVTYNNTHGRNTYKWAHRNDVKAGPAPAAPRSTTTALNPAEEKEFLGWVKSKKVPFDPSPDADYDMRGFWKAMQSGDERATSAVSPQDGAMHFPDTWKTPKHKTFSNESIYATKDAPHWQGSKLIGNNGAVIADETPTIAESMAALPQTYKQAGPVESASALPSFQTDEDEINALNAKYRALMGQ